MASKLNRIGKDIMSAMKKATEHGTSAYDTTAEVRRIEGDIAWVHIAGGVDETPVKLTIAAKAGDSVQVRVGGGRAWITGNATAPPTDDRTAIYARTMASEAKVTAVQAQETADEAQAVAEDAHGKASEAITKANGSVASDTLHYLATDQSSGVTISTTGWTTSIQTITAEKPYLWIYHTYTKANGSVTHTQPVIIGTFGKDGTSVTILGSYNTLAELEAAHPTGSLGDAYMVAGDLYVWNDSEWENVGQIQGPKGDTGATGAKGDKGDKGDTGAKGDKGDKGDTGAQGAKGDKGDKGEDGQDGDDGVSVTGVYPQYYQSTSATALSGGSWQETLNYIDGRYIWTRERIIYSDNHTSYSSAVYNSVLTSAWINANSARQIAEDTNQYFWHTESGTDTGAHITEKTQEEFLDDPQNGGGNLLMRSNGLAVRDGLTELATFSGTGMTVSDGTGAPIATFSNSNGEGLIGLQNNEACLLGGYYDEDRVLSMSRYTTKLPSMSPVRSTSISQNVSATDTELRLYAGGGTNSNKIWLSADEININGELMHNGSPLADFVTAQGTDNGYTYTKWASGRLEAERIWNIGQVTLSTTETANTRVSNNITLPSPSLMTSGTIEASYAGNSSNSASYMERISNTSIRLAKNTTSNVTLQNVTFTLRLINGRWK